MTEEKSTAAELNRIAIEAGQTLLSLVPTVMDDDEALKTGNAPNQGLVEKEILIALPESSWQIFSVLVNMITLKDSVNTQEIPSVEDILNKVDAALGPLTEYTLPVAVMSNMIQRSLIDFFTATVHQELIIQLSEAITVGDVEKIKSITEKIKAYGHFLNKV